ncbi:hypothetical protein [Desulfoluna spongiiphila]|uniref:hypothetical protein n=1 Tax=Desulfoluna spongiiphila TaxID=419481 RepID=UPI0012584A7A|nr:hypothetical protein [Desulfoluna spongiiphila]VVS95571.1 hypothetical protein DBB_51480 [Desulfoluna spongiiphila]
MADRRTERRNNEIRKIVGSKKMGLEPEARANLIDVLHMQDAPSGLVSGAVKMIQEAKNAEEFMGMVKQIKSMRNMRTK